MKQTIKDGQKAIARDQGGRSPSLPVDTNQYHSIQTVNSGSAVSTSSIRRTIQVLDLLAEKGALGVRAVAQQLKLPAASVHRLLLDLAQEAVVERVGDGAWQLSYRLFAITDKQLDGLRFPRLARPFCERIAEMTREAVNVNALSGQFCVCIDKVRGNQGGIQLDWPIGSRGPLYCGGSAKSILAFLGEGSIEQVLSQPMTQFTPNTLTNPAKLRAELANIRKRGYSIDNQEMVIGVFCVGMPIVDRSGRPVGAISISGPSPKHSGPAITPMVEMLREATSKVSGRLGYGGPWPPEPIEHDRSN
jgi:DNA-binding IclR family transcriptional regulator